MLSKFKCSSLKNSSCSSRFWHIPSNRGTTCAEPSQASLVEVNEAEVRRLRAENDLLKLQLNSVVVQLNAALAQLEQTNAEAFQLKQKVEEQEKASFYCTQKDFWQLTKAARNNKKRKIRELIIKSVNGLKEFVPIEVCSLEKGNTHLVLFQT